MDLTQEKTLEEMLATLNDTVTISSGGYYKDTNGWSDPYYGAVPPLTADQISKVTFSGLGSNVSINGGGYTIGAGSNTYGHVWTTGTTGPYPLEPGPNSGKIKLTGKNADIEVNGWSLIDSIKRIEERLNLLTPDTKLEAEWEELQALGEQYRRLEQHIKDKQATWDRLKAMPPPVIE